MNQKNYPKENLRDPARATLSQRPRMLSNAREDRRTEELADFKNIGGQSMVEFAISLMVILLLLAGAINFGLALFTYVQMRDAAQEAALYGSISSNHAE